MIEQLSLFDSLYNDKDQFAQKIVDEFNKLETYWKDQFYVSKCNLENWDHINLKRKVLCITIGARNWDRQNTFIQFDGDKDSQLAIYNINCLSDYISKLMADKDFSYSITPWKIYIFFHNWEIKKV